MDEVGPWDLVDIRRGEGADAWLLAASLRRPHDIAGDPHDAVLLTEEVQCLDGLFGKADNSARREHKTSRLLAQSDGNAAKYYKVSRHLD